MNKVAVLLAVYNGRTWIDEQLESILAQVEVSVDVFISIDLSSDGSWEYLTAKYNKFDNVYFLPYGDRYGSAGKNFYRLVMDVNFDGYDYISFADQDDIWYTDKLKRAIEIIVSKQIDAYSSNVLAFWEDGRTCLIDKAQSQTAFDYYFEAAGPGCTYVFTNRLGSAFREFLKSKELARDVSLHDWLIYAYARSHNYSWYIDSVPGMKYRQHSSNQVGANISFKMWVKRIKLVNSGWYRTEVYKLKKLFETNFRPIKRITITRNYSNNIILIPHVSKLRRRGRDKIILSMLLLLNFF
ncbi:glycosyltransferase [Leclercia adecarboxylata]|uniref:glycosyltransferase n=1 Tax=Leclercia adecarboxylata TaxID=83655 RepID=UPI00202A1B8E|nr:glycosyltransferase [Leclercia adecarboxylata]URN97883.1 glycosyltransferase [Leclercia adecarboxylata]